MSPKKRGAELAERAKHLAFSGEKIAAICRELRIGRTRAVELLSETVLLALVRRTEPRQISRQTGLTIKEISSIVARHFREDRPSGKRALPRPLPDVQRLWARERKKDTKRRFSVFPFFGAGTEKRRRK